MWNVSIFLFFENKDSSIYRLLSELQILTADTGANCSDESYWLIDDRKYPNIILGKENFDFDKKVFGDIAHF